MSLSVAILGASHKPNRYSYKAQVMLMEKGHSVFPVSGNGRDILDVPGYDSIKDIVPPVDTVTLYLSPVHHQPICQDISESKPRRIIFNPGTESQQLEEYYQDKGIETIRACTLVMLSTDQFD
jgi:hypothetical protein